MKEGNIMRNICPNCNEYIPETEKRTDLAWKNPFGPVTIKSIPTEAESPVPLLRRVA